ncbi:MAG: cytochrome b [Burkholderiaceae bacterium]|nr:cytochrome b [Burkholderiaceae bacterium]
MNWRNTSKRYGCLSVGLHWLTLLLMAAVYAFVELHELFPKDTPERAFMMYAHFSLGLLVMVLTLARLGLRWSAPTPRIEPPIPHWQAVFSQLVHGLLYLLLLGLPLVGWMMVSASGRPVLFFGIELPALLDSNRALSKLLKEVHETIGTLGYALIALHAAAALVHHYVMHDNTLTRMLPWRREHS